VSEIVLERE